MESRGRLEGRREVGLRRQGHVHVVVREGSVRRGEEAEAGHLAMEMVVVHLARVALFFLLMLVNGRGSVPSCQAAAWLDE